MKLNNMKHIKSIKEHWSNKPDNSPEEMTVGKLIDILKKHDPDQPVRLGYSGYNNQEIKNITSGKECFWKDNDEREEYPIVQINSK